MNNWRMEVKGMIELRQKTEKELRDLRGEPMLAAMRDATLLVTRSARKEAPHDRGILRNSILPEIKRQGGNLLGVVGSNLSYAPHQELGTRPFWPPMAAIEAWAKRKGINAYLVARAIATHGIKPKRFLETAFGQNYYRIQQRIEQAVAKILE